MRRGFPLAILIILSLANGLRGGEIDAPAEAAEYSLVRCKSVTEGKSYLWWILGPNNFADMAKVGDGRECVFTGPPGTYNIMLAITLADGTQDQAQKTIRIAGNTPPPNPNPNPNPGPGPNPNPPPAPEPLPDGTYKLAQFAHDATLGLPADAKHIAAKFAVTFDSVASQIAAGTISSVTAANSLVRTTNEAILKADPNTSVIASWQKIWSPAMNGKLSALNTAGMKSLADHATAYREIAIGLRAVK